MLKILKRVGKKINKKIMTYQELRKELNKVTKNTGFYILEEELSLIRSLIQNGGVRCNKYEKKDGSKGKWVYVRMGSGFGAKQRIKEFNSVLSIKIKQKQTSCI